MPDTIGGKTFAELGLEIEPEYQRPMAAPTRDYTVSIPNRHGAWDFGADLGPKPFSLPCHLTEETAAGLQAAIDQVTNHLFDATGRPRTLKLVFEEDPEKYTMVRFSGSLPINRIFGIGKFTLPLIAYDPFKYLFVLNNEITWESKEITFEMRNIKWGSRGGGEQKFTSPGYYYAWSNGQLNVRPTIAITGSADELTLSVNGKTLTLEPFTNETITIDGPSYSVTKGGKSALSFVSGVTNFYLVPGENPIYIDGTNFDVTISVVFRDQYL